MLKVNVRSKGYKTTKNLRISHNSHYLLPPPTFCIMLPSISLVTAVILGENIINERYAICLVGGATKMYYG